MVDRTYLSIMTVVLILIGHTVFAQILPPPPPCPDLTFNVTNESVSGALDGALDMTLDGGVGPFSYSWSGPGTFTASTQDLSNLSAGAYFVTVVSANCTVTNGTTVSLATSNTVPTLSEWGLILMVLLLISYGSIVITKQRLSVATAGKMKVRAPILSNLPVSGKLFSNTLTYVLPIALAGYILVHLTIGTNGILDFFGTMVSAIFVSYIIHLSRVVKDAINK